MSRSIIQQRIVERIVGFPVAKVVELVPQMMVQLVEVPQNVSRQQLAGEIDPTRASVHRGVSASFPRRGGGGDEQGSDSRCSCAAGEKCHLQCLKRSPRTTFKSVLLNRTSSTAEKIVDVPTTLLKEQLVEGPKIVFQDLTQHFTFEQFADIPELVE